MGKLDTETVDNTGMAGRADSKADNNRVDTTAWYPTHFLLIRSLWESA